MNVQEVKHHLSLLWTGRIRWWDPYIVFDQWEHQAFRRACLAAGYTPTWLSLFPCHRLPPPRYGR
jgi:hypothetical protein